MICWIEVGAEAKDQKIWMIASRKERSHLDPETVSAEKGVVLVTEIGLIDLLEPKSMLKTLLVASELTSHRWVVDCYHQEDLQLNLIFQDPEGNQRLVVISGFQVTSEGGLNTITNKTEAEACTEMTVWVEMIDMRADISLRNKSNQFTNSLKVADCPQ